jgi:hypothetical protein
MDIRPWATEPPRTLWWGKGAKRLIGYVGGSSTKELLEGQHTSRGPKRLKSYCKYAHQKTGRTVLSVMKLRLVYYMG